MSEKEEKKTIWHDLSEPRSPEEQQFYERLIDPRSHLTREEDPEKHEQMKKEDYMYFLRWEEDKEKLLKSFKQSECGHTTNERMWKFVKNVFNDTELTTTEIIRKIKIYFEWYFLNDMIGYQKYALNDCFRRLAVEDLGKYY